MNKYKKVSKDDVLKTFYDLQTKFWEAGCWVDGISAEFLANKMETSTYQIRKAYKQLAEEGYLKLEKVPIAFDEYDNGLYTESNPYLFCKVYTLTNKAKDKFKKNGDEDIEYRNKILSEQECEFDTYKIEHDNQFVCGIDNGFCHRDTCTKDFNKYGCMYLK
jgi:hypothetical protein